MNVLQEEFVEVGLGQGRQTGKGERMLPLVLWATPSVPTFPCLPTQSGHCFATAKQVFLAISSWSRNEGPFPLALA